MSISDVLLWDINGASLIAWVSDDEFFEIYIDGVIFDGPLGGTILSSEPRPKYRLTVNSLMHANSVPLGVFDSFQQARVVAQDHLEEE